MKRLVTLLAVAALGWHSYSTNGSERVALANVDAPALKTDLGVASARAAQFSCDGRRHCSQMTSCAEATFFLQNCPGTEMDGDRDGVPCERQWCR